MRKKQRSSIVHGNYIWYIMCVCGTCLATPSHKDNISIQIYKHYLAFIILSLYFNKINFVSICILDSSFMVSWPSRIIMIIIYCRLGTFQVLMLRPIFIFLTIRFNCVDISHKRFKGDEYKTGIFVKGFELRRVLGTCLFENFQSKKK